MTSGFFSTTQLIKWEDLKVDPLIRIPLTLWRGCENILNYGHCTAPTVLRRKYGHSRNLSTALTNSLSYLKDVCSIFLEQLIHPMEELLPASIGNFDLLMTVIQLPLLYWMFKVNIWIYHIPSSRIMRFPLTWHCRFLVPGNTRKFLWRFYTILA